MIDVFRDFLKTDYKIHSYGATKFMGLSILNLKFYKIKTFKKTDISNSFKVLYLAQNLSKLLSLYMPITDSKYKVFYIIHFRIITKLLKIIS